MIHLVPKPLPELQAKQIRDWINLPAARLFRDVIAQMAMACSANGANEAIQGEDGDLAIENAKIEYQKAVTANNLLKLMAEMQDPQYEFQHFDIGPKPAITPTTNEE